jgi:hypothetical protein
VGLVGAALAGLAGTALAAPGLPAPAALWVPGASQSHSHYGQASGRIGSNYLKARTELRGGVARLEGTLGLHSVQLHRSSNSKGGSSIEGTVSNALGGARVSVEVRPSGGSYHLLGVANGQSLDLQIHPVPGGSLIRGYIGGRQVTVQARSTAYGTSYSGHLRELGGRLSPIELRLDPGPEGAADLVLPLFAYTGIQTGKVIPGPR